MMKGKGPWEGVLLPAFLCAQMFIERETSGYEAGIPLDPLWYQRKIILRQWLVIGFYAMKNYKAFLLGDNLDSRAFPSSSLQRKTEDEALRRQNKTEALESRMVWYVWPAVWLIIYCSPFRNNSSKLCSNLELINLNPKHTCCIFQISHCCQTWRNTLREHERKNQLETWGNVNYLGVNTVIWCNH